MNKTNNETIKNRLTSHYKDCISEPLELMKKLLTKEEYIGFVKGNIIKYRVRAGHKGNAEDDIYKALCYEELYKALQEADNEAEKA